MGTLTKIKELCAERNVVISRLEKDLGFSNASLAALRKEDVSFDRVVKIAKYFDVPLSYFTDNSTEQKEMFTKEEKQIITAYRRVNDITKDNICLLLGVKRDSVATYEERMA